MTVIVLAVALLAAVAVFNTRLLIDAVTGGRGRVLYYVPTGRPAVALTIDDGPDGETTAPMLELLGRFQARATFFLIAAHMDDNGPLLARMVAEGHELANHMREDFPAILLSAGGFERSLLAADQALRRFCAPRWFRPANGFYSRGILAVAHRHRYRCVLGDILPLDLLLPLPWLMAAYVAAVARPGSIIILHDRGRRGQRTLKTLALLLPRLRRKGYAVVTVTALAGQAGLAD